MTTQILKQQVFSFLGPPGAGKGTLAHQCKINLGFKILSTGNLCRKHVFEKTSLGSKFKKFLDAGQLIPDELIITMTNDWLKVMLKAGERVILDGYPRTVPQIKALTQFLDKNFVREIFRVFIFKIPDKNVIERLVERLICEHKSCQTVYSPAFPPKQPGICDNCACFLQKREDDSISIVKKRLSVYSSYKKELFDKYISMQIPVETLLVKDVSVKEVFQMFEQKIFNTEFSIV